MPKQTPSPECCSVFDPKPWQEEIFEWQDKLFIKEKVFTLFYMPLNFGAVMKRCMEKIDQAQAKVVDGAWLSDHTSMWNMDLYVAVDRKIEGATNLTISGKFFSKVYEGDYSKMGEWQSDFANSAKAKNLQINKSYMWYTTCPKCAKKYGKNYVVIIGEVK
jgi:hypothetical protein